MAHTCHDIRRRLERAAQSDEPFEHVAQLADAHLAVCRACQAWMETFAEESDNAATRRTPGRIARQLQAVQRVVPGANAVAAQVIAAVIGPRVETNAPARLQAAFPPRAWRFEHWLGWAGAIIATVGLAASSVSLYVQPSVIQLIVQREQIDVQAVQTRIAERQKELERLKEIEGRQSTPLALRNAEMRRVGKVIAIAPADQPAPRTRVDRDILVDGRVSASYDIFVDSDMAQHNWVAAGGSDLRIAYPGGQRWGAVLVAVEGPLGFARPTKDFGHFESLAIEARGETGGETFEIGVKDSMNPDDGVVTRMRLTLGREFQRWVLPLDKLAARQDLRRLSTVVEFVFEGPSPQTVFVKNIRYHGRGS